MFWIMVSMSSSKGFSSVTCLGGFLDLNPNVSFVELSRSVPCCLTAIWSQYTILVMSKLMDLIQYYNHSLMTSKI
jgi:hypothetical protein